MFAPFRQQIRLHSTIISKATKSKFPALSEVTLEDLGAAPGQTRFGFDGAYYLQRSTYNKLPIYTEYKQGNVPYTEIRRIHGNIVQLRKDLELALPYVPKDNIKVLMESKKILIKGNYRNALKKIFEDIF